MSSLPPQFPFISKLTKFCRLPPPHRPCSYSKNQPKNCLLKGFIEPLGRGCGAGCGGGEKKRSFKAKTTELVNRMRSEVLSLALKGVGSTLSSFASGSLALRKAKPPAPMTGEKIIIIIIIHSEYIYLTSQLRQARPGLVMRSNKAAYLSTLQPHQPWAMEVFFYCPSLCKRESELVESGMSPQGYACLIIGVWVSVPAPRQEPCTLCCGFEFQRRVQQPAFSAPA